MAIRRASPRVRFRKFSAKALGSQLDGVERPYPVYLFSGKGLKTERPETPGQPYRRYRDFP